MNYNDEIAKIFTKYLFYLPHKLSTYNADLGPQILEMCHPHRPNSPTQSKTKKKEKNCNIDFINTSNSI